MLGSLQQALPSGPDLMRRIPLLLALILALGACDSSSPGATAPQVAAGPTDFIYAETDLSLIHI